MLWSGLIGGAAGRYAYFSMLSFIFLFLQERSEAAASTRAEEVAAALLEKGNEGHAAAKDGRGQRCTCQAAAGT